MATNKLGAVYFLISSKGGKETGYIGSTGRRVVERVDQHRINQIGSTIKLVYAIDDIPNYQAVERGYHAALVKYRLGRKGVRSSTFEAAGVRSMIEWLAKHRGPSDVKV